MRHVVRSTALFLTLFLPSQSLLAASLDVVSSTTTVQVGSRVDISVVVSDLAEMAPPSMGTYDIVLIYDSALFAFDTVAQGMGLGPATGGTIAGEADLNVFEVSLLTPVEIDLQEPGSFALFTATFEVLSDGVGVFDVLPNPALGDENGDPLLVAAVTPASVTAATIVDIPTLSSWGLLLTGLVLLFAGLYRIRRSLA